MWYRVLFACLVLGVPALGMPPVPAAAQVPEIASRGPRFLYAPATQLETDSSRALTDARNAAVLRQRLSLALRDVSLTDALREIAQRGRLQLIYTSVRLPAARRVTFEAKQITVGTALTEALFDTGIDVVLTRSGQMALVQRWASQPALADTGVLVGRITDAKSGSGIPGAEVLLERTRWRATADNGGRYRLTGIEPGNYTLVARRFGYAKHSRQVVVRAEREDTISVALEPMAAKLDELVTTATGKQRKRELGHDITTIRADSVMQHAPIRNLADLLENRVPGLTARHTSGAPGDPVRLRLRGLGSAYRSNDPVVIVDGVRVYAAQAEARSGNLANPNAAAPSPLDQIDPNIIEKVEVFKGPSAATLYGADAANGVIVVTTKRGKPGPTRWNASITHSRETRADRYPTGYYRWGRVTSFLGGEAVRFCTLLDRFCTQDSLVQFQALNLPSLTPIGGHGQSSVVSLTASGGVPALTYSITGTYSDKTGLLQLPAYEVRRFDSLFSQAPPDWMQNPHHYTEWSVASNVTARLGSTANVTLGTMLSHSKQQRTNLENQLGSMARTYVDTLRGLYYQPGEISLSPTLSSDVGSADLTPISNILQDYYGRSTASTLAFTTGLTATWTPRVPWFSADGHVGLNVMPRDDQFLFPAGLVGHDSPLDSGEVTWATGRSVTTSAGLRGQFRKPLGAGFALVTDIGADLQAENIGDVRTSAQKLLPGTTSITGARVISATESRSSRSVYGWHIEPRLTGQRIALSTGFRLDGSSTNGVQLTGTGSGGSGRGFLKGLLALPKLNGSWVISEEPWFPFQSLFSSLRLRGAYGQAQVQPGPTDRLRIYTGGAEPTATANLSKNIGNTQLRPERSTEFEGGFDADLLDGRLSVELTGFRRLQMDALMPLTLPSSVNGGGSVWTNVGNIMNRGMTLSLTMTPLRLPAVAWSAQLHYYRNSNKLLKLGQGVLPNPGAGLVEGYPIGSRWDRPILGFADANEDGIIQREEIQVGDSLVYLGRLLPAYTMGLNTNLALFGGAVQLTADFSREGGATQKDELARVNWVLTRALVDPSAPLSQQAAVIAFQSLQQNQVQVSPGTDYGLYQMFSTFRFQSMSLNYNAPTRVARFLGAQRASVALQGRNLGLHSTYRGRDPDVTAWAPGEQVRDSGQLPEPRTWQLALFLEY